MTTRKTLSSALEKISRDHLECSICQEKYQQPKVLDCQHSFCEQCLVKYRSINYRGAREFPCPVCRRKTKLPQKGIQGLKTNFYIIGLADDLALQENLASSVDIKQLCELCGEDNEAAHRCLDCAKNICAICHKTHLRIDDLSHHTIATLDDVRQARVRLRKHHPKCKNHQGETMRFFCTTCEQLICRDCTVIDHCKPAHTYIDCQQAASTYKQSLTELCSSLEEALNNLMKSQENVLRVKRQLDKTVEGTVAEVRAQAAEIKALVTTKENRIIDRIRRLQKDRSEKLDDCEKTMGVMTDGIQYSLETARDVTSAASDSDLISLYPTISKDLRFLASQNPPAVDERLAFLKFKRKGTGDIDLGKLLQQERWALLREIGKMGNGPEEFTAARSILGLEPHEIVVTDSCNQRVAIYSTKGRHKNTIPMEHGPVDVAATGTHSRLVVVCQTSPTVKVFNKDRTPAFEFPTVPRSKGGFEFPTVPRSKGGKSAVRLRSVAVKTDGTIVVGDVGRKALTEHSPTDGSLIRTIPVQTAPQNIATDCSGRVVISGWGQGVDVIDGNSTTLFKISPAIEGKQVQHCTGVCCDSSGIYIAIHNGLGTGHIHHYGTKGSFICCVAKGLYNPRGIAFTADGQHLLVSDQYTVKMYHVVS